MEVGYAAQNACLQAIALDLAPVFVGAFPDTEVQELPGLAANHESLGLMPVGRARQTRDRAGSDRHAFRGISRRGVMDTTPAVRFELKLGCPKIAPCGGAWRHREDHRDRQPGCPPCVRRR